MILDLKFVITGFILILALIPLYIYRKEIYAKFAKEGNINIFIREIDAFLTLHYPKFNFNFDIIEKLDEEADIRRKEILIVEDIVKQFATYEYELNTQATVDKDKLWKSYDSNSKLQKDNKFPIDWPQRKETAWMRDAGKCDRCGTKTKLVDAQPLLAKQMKNGGGFNLENIVILCNDCSRILRTSNIEKTRKDLHILDNLMRRVKN